MAMIFAVSELTSWGMRQKQRYEDISKAYKAQGDSIRTLIREDGKKSAIISTLQADKKSAEVIISQIPSLKATMDELNLKYKQLQNATSVQSRMIANIRPAVFMDTNITVIGLDTAYLLSLDFEDEYIKMNTSIPMVDCSPLTDSVDFSLEVNTNMDIVTYWDRRRWFGLSWTPKWFGTREYETVVTYENPHVTLGDIESLILKK